MENGKRGGLRVQAKKKSSLGCFMALPFGKGRAGARGADDSGSQFDNSGLPIIACAAAGPQLLNRRLSS